MLRFYLRLSVLLMLTFAVCSFVLMALGSTQPIHPALRGFVEGCEGIPQPCWYGIVPGVTTMRQAQQLLDSADYQYVETDDVLKFMRYRSQDPLACTTIDIHYLSYEINYIQFDCDELTVGDSLTISDDGLQNLMMYDADLFIYMSDDIAIRSIFPQPGLFAPIADIIIPNPFGEGYQEYCTLPWHGFAPVWTYSQLHTQASGC